MKLQYRGFYHIAPRKSNSLADASFVYPVMFFILDTSDNSIMAKNAEITVPGSVTNVETDPFIMKQLVMMVDAMSNNVQTNN